MSPVVTCKGCDRGVLVPPGESYPLLSHPTLPRVFGVGVYNMNDNGMVHHQKKPMETPALKVWGNVYVTGVA